MVAALKKNGTPVWYLLAKDEGHRFTKVNDIDFQFYATVLFMKKVSTKIGWLKRRVPHPFRVLCGKSGKRK